MGVNTYRVYYVERMPRGARDWMSNYGLRPAEPEDMEARHEVVEWEETVEARSAPEALESFFREHVGDRTQVMWVDEAGESRPLEGIEDYDPERTYIWVEGDKLMEYQGMDETEPGMVTCPVCGGEGEVPEEVAAEFLEEDSEEVTWG